MGATQSIIELNPSASARSGQRSLICHFLLATAIVCITGSIILQAGEGPRAPRIYKPPDNPA